MKPSHIAGRLLRGLAWALAGGTWAMAVMAAYDLIVYAESCTPTGVGCQPGSSRCWSGLGPATPLTKP